MYKLATGIIPSKKRGVDVVIIMIVEVRLRKQVAKDLIELDMLSSVASISFVNRLTTRPLGVDSKKRKLPF